MPKPTIVSKRPVPNYIPEQTQITEVRFDDSSVAFEGPGGASIHTYGLELDFWLGVWIGDFKAAVRLLDEEDYLKFGRVFEIMLHAFERNMEEVMHAVYENIGLITCEMIGVNNAPGSGQIRIKGAIIKRLYNGDSAPKRVSGLSVLLRLYFALFHLEL